MGIDPRPRPIFSHLSYCRSDSHVSTVYSPSDGDSSKIPGEGIVPTRLRTMRACTPYPLRTRAARPYRCRFRTLPRPSDLGHHPPQAGPPDYFGSVPCPDSMQPRVLHRLPSAWPPESPTDMLSRLGVLVENSLDVRQQAHADRAGVAASSIWLAAARALSPQSPRQGPLSRA